MKKLFSLLTAVFFILISSFTAFAQEYNSEIFDNASELKISEEKLIDELNRSLGYNFEIPLSADDFDYSQFIKIYDAEYALNKDGLNIDNAEKLINPLNYFYSAYIDYENKHIIATIVKDDTAAKEGWRISSCGCQEQDSPNSKQDIINVINNTGNKYSKIQFVAYPSGNINFVAMLISESGEVQFKILDGAIDEEFVNVHTDDKFYTFEEIKEIAAQFVVDEENPIGGTASVNIFDNPAIIIGCALAGAVIILAAAAASVIVYKKKHKKIETINFE